jgi:hypothetical protein
LAEGQQSPPQAETDEQVNSKKRKDKEPVQLRSTVLLFKILFVRKNKKPKANPAHSDVVALVTCGLIR